MERKQNIEEIFENAKEPHPFNLVMLSIRLDPEILVTIL
jgi:hypothetical protein